MPYNVFIPDELRDNKLLSRFVRRLTFKVDRYYQQKYLNLSAVFSSFNGPLYLPVLNTILQDQDIDLNTYYLLTCFYLLGSQGKLPVRINEIKTFMNWKQGKTYLYLTPAQRHNLIKRHRTPRHPNGASYQLTYQGSTLIERVSKLFYAKVLELPTT